MLMHPALSASTPLGSERSVESCKAAVFPIANHWLALPATAILKVIPASALDYAAGKTDKLALWGNHPLVQLDLHPLLTDVAAEAALKNDTLKNDALNREHPLLNSRRYILIVRSQTGDQCAIPVDRLPILVEIPLPETQILPSSYRQTIGNVARYMAVLPYKGSVLTVLLLDVGSVLHLLTA